MTTVQVSETSVTVNNSPIQGYVHPNVHSQATYEMTPVLKTFTQHKTLHKTHNKLRTNLRIY